MDDEVDDDLVVLLFLYEYELILTRATAICGGVARLLGA